jgi:putative membrane protein
MRTPTCLLIAALAFGPWAAAQDAAPETSQAFVTTVAQAGLAEIELGKLAREATSNDAVRIFASRMIIDYQRAQAELAAIARSKGLMVPTEVDASQAGTIQALRGKAGARFDKDYARRMLGEIEKTAGFFRSVFDPSVARIADPDLTQYARSFLSVLREHKRLAEDLYAARN